MLHISPKQSIRFSPFVISFLFTNPSPSNMLLQRTETMIEQQQQVQNQEHSFIHYPQPKKKMNTQS
jgi:hypothetical protein